MTTQPHEVTLTRLYNAPRERVFQAWTDPRLMAQWYGPHGFSAPLCELDVRPGGTYTIHMQGPDGTIYPDKGTFREVTPPERIVFTSGAFEDETGRPQLETLNTLTLTDLGQQTQLTLHIVVLRALPGTEGPLSGMETGWNQSLTKLAVRLIGPVTIDPDRRIVELTHRFNAPRELVYKLYTDPQLLPQWWGPRYLTTTVDQMDVRPGGVWRFVQRAPDGGEHAFNGVYREVAPPEKLVYTFEYEAMPGHILLETVTFTAQGSQTLVTARDEFQSADDLYGMVMSGMEDGVIDSYERTVELLQALVKETR